MITLLTLSLSLWLVALPLIGSSEPEKKSDSLHEVQIEAQDELSPSTGRVLHSGFSPDDYRQEIVAKAYELWGLDFLALIECENGLRKVDRTGDRGQSHGLCQLNQRWHHEVYDGRRSSREFQLSVCYSKRKWGTKFYWPQRLIWGKRCWDVAKMRFMVTEAFTLVD